MGEFNLLHNHYHVPHVEVHEVNPEVGMCNFLTLEVLQWAPYGPGRSREGDPAYTGVSWMRGCLPLGSPTRTMLILAVCRQKPLRQIRRALRTVGQLPFSFPKTWSQPCHYTLMGRPRVTVSHATWLEDHPTVLFKLVCISTLSNSLVKKSSSAFRWDGRGKTRIPPSS